MSDSVNTSEIGQGLSAKERFLSLSKNERLGLQRLETLLLENLGLDYRGKGDKQSSAEKVFGLLEENPLGSAYDEERQIGKFSFFREIDLKTGGLLSNSEQIWQTAKVLRSLGLVHAQHIAAFFGVDLKELLSSNRDALERLAKTSPAFAHLREKGVNLSPLIKYFNDLPSVKNQLSTVPLSGEGLKAYAQRVAALKEIDERIAQIPRDNPVNIDFQPTKTDWQVEEKTETPGFNHGSLKWFTEKLTGLTLSQDRNSFNDPLLALGQKLKFILQTISGERHSPVSKKLLLHHLSPSLKQATVRVGLATTVAFVSIGAATSPTFAKEPEQSQPRTHQTAIQPDVSDKLDYEINPATHRPQKSTEPPTIRSKTQPEAISVVLNKLDSLSAPTFSSPPVSAENDIAKGIESSLGQLSKQRDEALMAERKKAVGDLALILCQSEYPEAKVAGEFWEEKATETLRFADQIASAIKEGRIDPDAVNNKIFSKDEAESIDWAMREIKYIWGGGGDPFSAPGWPNKYDILSANRAKITGVNMALLLAIYGQETSFRGNCFLNPDIGWWTIRGIYLLKKPEYERTSQLIRVIRDKIFDPLYSNERRIFNETELGNAAQDPAINFVSFIYAVRMQLGHTKEATSNPGTTFSLITKDGKVNSTFANGYTGRPEIWKPRVQGFYNAFVKFAKTHPEYHLLDDLLEDTLMANGVAGERGGT